jgi:hypothetical protein
MRVFLRQCMHNLIFCLPALSFCCSRE